eukprot:CAMPEP_0184703876 /NCGR_PEP_ID=MMETSP0313-20130426/29354_1 /TAXON_ID=2792 /ORGANISM="Porphyridium aerugineum, Strain SAG 1380-2" /LENGTH=32 /DNA_ID= /DNA_START= /DNA_END= /DNA_ORIENTATION=
MCTSFVANNLDVNGFVTDDAAPRIDDWVDFES